MSVQRGFNNNKTGILTLSRSDYLNEIKTEKAVATMSINTDAVPQALFRPFYISNTDASVVMGNLSDDRKSVMYGQTNADEIGMIPTVFKYGDIPFTMRPRKPLTKDQLR